MESVFIHIHTSSFDANLTVSCKIKVFFFSLNVTTFTNYMDICFVCSKIGMATFYFKYLSK